jgi:hypothetical protein
MSLLSRKLHRLPGAKTSAEAGNGVVFGGLVLDDYRVDAARDSKRASPRVRGALIYKGPAERR